MVWRGGRVVEGARLESVFTGNRNAGSNPAPSASYLSATIPISSSRHTKRPNLRGVIVSAFAVDVRMNTLATAPVRELW